jgi:serine protease Do
MDRFPLALTVVLAAVVGLAPIPAPAQPNDPAEALDAMRRVSNGFEALAQQVRPAVVQVKARTYDGARRSGRGSSQLSRSQTSASGFFVDSTGYVVTNAHVVSGAYRVQVQLPKPPPPAPGEKSILRPRGDLLEATVVGTDAETDVALLKVPGSGYPTLSFGNSDELRRGQVVFAFGSPMGLENSVSMGVVSAMARQLQEGDPMIYVQTDAAINPGSSGGPLVNTEGEVVGLNTFILSESGNSAGLGFAGPSNIVESVTDQLREYGRVRRGVIGVNAQTLTPELARALGVDPSYRVVLADVLPGSPANRAGLRPGDVVTHLNGEPMGNGRELDVNLYGDLGTLARLRVVRGDSTFTTSVRVVERRDPESRFAEMASPEEHSVDALGILALPVTDRVENIIPNMRIPSGALVASTTRPPAPWGDRLRPGDVIYTVDGTRVDGPAALRDRLAPVPPDGRVLVHVLRDGRMHYLVLPVR